jgi:hypothetical protein
MVQLPPSLMEELDAVMAASTVKSKDVVAP